MEWMNIQNSMKACINSKQIFWDCICTVALSDNRYIFSTVLSFHLVITRFS